MSRPFGATLRYRSLVALCLALAVVLAFLGLSRGNPRFGMVAPAILLVYAGTLVLAERYGPGARLVSGAASDTLELSIVARARTVAWNLGLLTCLIGVGFGLGADWEPGVWMALPGGVLLLGWIGSLLWFARERT